jgi:hypothetical protein
MEVLIKACPACGSVVMGDESTCSGCGKPLPKRESDLAQRGETSRAAPDEQACPRCHARVPRGVLRCRDCGSYMNSDIEAAVLAKQMLRGYGAMPGGPFGQGYAPPGGSSFAEVADDADFDLNPSVDALDATMQGMVDQQAHGKGPEGGAGNLQDDFEMGEGTGSYAVSDDAPETAPGEPVSQAEARTVSPTEIPLAPGAPGEVAHSVQTGGDVLLDAALEEERDTQHRMKGGRRRLRRSTTTALGPDRCLVFCPNGHRIQVHVKHRGRTGRCPNCKAIFFVPAADLEEAGGEAGGMAQGTAAPADGASQTGYSRWITEVRLHRLNPAKLKLKPGSLSSEFEPVDLGVSADHLLLAVLFMGSGPFRAMQEAKKKVATRQAMLDHLAAKMPIPDLPVPKHYELSAEQLQLLRIAQPTVPGEESVFADVPVFGEGRIAVRLPAADAAGERAYLSFSLSQFREFSTILGDLYGLTEFGAGTEIPMSDDFEESTCHYSESVLHAIPAARLPYYKADPSMKLTVVGRRCETCKLVVSEDSRKKEKIGGASDSSVAKAKCPKCKQKFGNITLFGFSS